MASIRAVTLKTVFSKDWANLLVVANRCLRLCAQSQDDKPNKKGARLANRIVKHSAGACWEGVRLGGSNASCEILIKAA